jgi:hypothetical protein
MGLSVELDRDEKLTVGQWEAFLRQARQAGAADGTPVAEVMPDGTDILCAYRVEIPDGGPAAPEQVTLPTWLVHDLLSVVSVVAQSDGDVRGLESGAQKALQSTYDHLLTPVLGENPYSKPDEPAGE